MPDGACIHTSLLLVDRHGDSIHDFRLLDRGKSEKHLLLQQHCYCEKSSFRP